MDNGVLRGPGHGEKITRMQEQAIAALLAHPTVKAAAAALELNECTLREWLSQPDFAAAFKQARKEVVDSAIAHLQGVTSEAVATLRALLTADKPAARLGAAKAVLEFSLQAVALDELTERIEAMEKRLKDRLNDGPFLGR